MGFSHEDKWEIYTKPEGACSACEKALQLFQDKKIKYKQTIGLKPNTNNPTDEVIERMKSINRSDFTTWPKIFKNGKFIGGFSDLKNIKI